MGEFRAGVVLAALLLSAIALSIPAHAEQGHIKLLAVAESGKNLTGAIADLSLEIRPGKGRVFLETFPPTKEDTQISMRFAKQVACSFVGADCSDKDFIYTIRTGPGIVGGPSAGAAAAVLTSALLMGVDLRYDVAITGTINSGGLIGSVGGLRSKVTAASKNGVKTALIPLGSRMVKQGVVVTIERANETHPVESEEDLPEPIQEGPMPPKDEPVPLVIANISIPRTGIVNVSKRVVREIDLAAFGRSLGVDVQEVSTLADALIVFTGKNFSRTEPELTIAPEYTLLMRNISQELCQRSQELMAEASSSPNAANASVQAKLNDSRRFQEMAANASHGEDYYSSASFCFRANIIAGILALQRQGNESVQEALEEVERGVEALQTSLNSRRVQTIMDLQASMVTQERLDEARDILDALKREDASEDHAVAAAYARERLESARAWSRFFGAPGSSYSINEDRLHSSCLDKVREAQERFEYVNYYIPNALAGVKRSIDRANAYAGENRFQKCLHVASLAKAEANLVASVIGADASGLPLLLDQKLRVAKDSIARAQHNGYFPIVGYSYYEYARNLGDQDRNAALLFAEYALELSNLDMYFEQGSSHETEGGVLNVTSMSNPLDDTVTGSVVAQTPHTGTGWSMPFLSGLFVGVALMAAVVALSSPKGPRARAR